MNSKELTDIIVSMVNAAGLSAKEKGELIGNLAIGLTSKSTPSTTSKEPIRSEVPAQVPRGTTIQIPKNKECKCKACNKKVYKVAYDVYDNISGEEFMGAFKPYNNAPVMTEVQMFGDSYGNVSIDCPLCNSLKSVWIMGDGTYSDIPDQDNMPLTIR